MTNVLPHSFKNIRLFCRLSKKLVESNLHLVCFNTIIEFIYRFLHDRINKMKRAFLLLIKRV